MASSRKSLPARDLPARVSAVISEHVRRGDRLVAGLSGGVDSVALVDLLQRLSGKSGFRLAAVASRPATTGITLDEIRAGPEGRWTIKGCGY